MAEPLLGLICRKRLRLGVSVSHSKTNRVRRATFILKETPRESGAGQGARGGIRTRERQEPLPGLQPGTFDLSVTLAMPGTSPSLSGLKNVPV